MKTEIKTVATKKPWWQSKTIWSAVIAIAIAVADTIASGNGWRSAVLAGFGALVIVLRKITSQPI